MTTTTKTIKTFTATAIVGAALLLSACGETTAQRVATGALLGAGLGVGASALMADSLWTGAIVGAGVGGVAGAAAQPGCQMGDYWCW